MDHHMAPKRDFSTAIRLDVEAMLRKDVAGLEYSCTQDPRMAFEDMWHKHVLGPKEHEKRWLRLYERRTKPVLLQDIVAANSRRLGHHNMNGPGHDSDQQDTMESISTHQ